MSLLIIQLSILGMFVVSFVVIIVSALKNENKLDDLKVENISLEHNLNQAITKNKVEIHELKIKRTKLDEETNTLNEKARQFEELRIQFENRKERIENKLTEKENKLEQEKSAIDSRRETLEHQREELKAKTDLMEMEVHKKKLEIANLNEKEAKEILFEDLRETNEQEYVNLIKEYKHNLELEKNTLAQNILLNAMENVVIDTTNSNSLKAVKIPSEDVKGRLIGRDGRNIKLIENLLGVNLIIDDTPGEISISSFNPIRKHIAIKTLETLIESGRINQVSIEDEYYKVKKQIDDDILEMGKEAVYRFNINDMDIGLIRELGKLSFRTSYGQNVLSHSIEAAEIARKIASELKLNPTLAARCVLLHDVGKVDSQELGKSHVELGVLLAQKYGEHENVINSIEAHHGDVEPDNVYANITIIADKMSAGRTGARRDTFDLFIERVETLENIALSVDGTSKAYALQGGRELRVIVEAENVSDAKLQIIASKIKKKVENEVIFPGIIKVNVIREQRLIVEAVKNNNLEGVLND